MFIFKKFQKQNSEQSIINTSNNNNNSVNNGQLCLGRGVQLMDHYLQKKFSRGIQYNMKIIIRGDRNVGKTCLFYRLQGGKFHEEYVASEEIKVASIQWNYNATDDIIKVEIWDVVDKGKKRENLNTISNAKDALKMHNNINSHSSNSCQQDDTNENDSSPALDAEFVDVYKGTNGVIFLFDMTKAWTFDYIVREIHRCPLNIPILILANHRDMGHHRVITADQVQGFIDTLLQEDLESKRKRTGQIKYAESSMRNGFGLRYLYKFFNLPYLHLQRETMLKQLERNKIEINAACQELDAMVDSDEYNYDIFLEMLTNQRRKMADQLSAIKKEIISPPKSASIPSNMANMINDVNKNETPQIVKPMPSIIIGANNPLPSKYQQQFQKKSLTNKDKHISIETQKVNTLSSVKNIEDFIPDEGEQNMFRKFLDEPTLPQTDLPPAIEEEDSEEEDTIDNNLVTKYQEELDPEDMIVQELKPNSNSPNEVNYSLVNNVIHEFNSEPEDSPNDKFDSNIKSEEIQQLVENTPVLNCDDIEALENLYISKHSKPNGHNFSDDLNPNKESIKENKKLNNQEKNDMKKKKKSSKSINKSPSNASITLIKNGDNAAEPIIKKKKATKLKTKNSSKNSLNRLEDYAIDDDERRQLEEFFGTDVNDSTDKHDHTSYQMF